MSLPFSGRALARLLLIVAVLGVFGAVGYVVLLSGGRQDARTVAAVDQSGAGMKLTGAEYTELEGGRKRWTLRATEARYFQKERKTELSGVRLVFFLDRGGVVELSSDHGALFAATKDIELWGRVEAVVPEGYRVATERALYRHKERTIASETPVRAWGPQVEVRGGRWMYDVDAQLARLEGGVNVNVSAPPQKEAAVRVP